MHYKIFIIWIYSLILFVSSLNNPYQKYTFYYETYLYSLNPETNFDALDDDKFNDNSTQKTIINQSHSDPLTFDITINNISINILKTSGNRPYIINISPIHDVTNNKEISINYDDYDQFNSIQIWYTPHRQRRRLRWCTKTHTTRCGWWGWGRCTHHHRHWCSPIAPPRTDTYWLQRWKKKGRFIAMYPGIHAMHWYNYWGCARYCTAHYGGLASIHSNRENDLVKKACYDILVNPNAKNQIDYSGHWRGHSCYIGLTRPFKTWDDKKKVVYTAWYPGEPNNWGHREDCTEQWNDIHWSRGHNGKWNDASCHGTKPCVCQEPRGIVKGNFIGVQAERPYVDAATYCKDQYGTTLATVLNDGDNGIVAKLCKEITMPHTTPHCWLGLQRPFHEWDDGTNAEEKYENWYPGEPNNKHEKCVETYSEHDGRWNDLPCHWRRYFICNARTAIQRMEFNEREKMINKRMQRHKIRWEKYQQEAHRKKIRKAFFARMKQQRALMRKQQREQQERMREYYRQMAFNSAMSNMGGTNGGYSTNGGYGTNGGYNMFGGGGGGGFGAFSGQSAFFGDNYMKRRRLREWIESNSEGIKYKNKMRLEAEKKKLKKKEIFKEEKKRLREQDDDEMFYERMYDLDRNENELKEIEENVNPSPKRCILMEDNKDLFELCLNDDYLEVIKYIEKVLRFDDDEEDEEEMSYDGKNIGDNNQYFTNNTLGSYLLMDFEEFEGFRYKQAMIHDKRDNDDNDDNDDDEGVHIKKVDNVQYMRVNEYIYDHDNNHKKQCFEDNHEYEICLEFKDIENEMLLYVDSYRLYINNEDNWISFENDKDWNDINYINNADKNNEKIKKCINYYQRKICLIQKLTKNKQNKHNEYNEYRIIIRKQQKDNDEDDEYAQMIKEYNDRDVSYRY